MPWNPPTTWSPNQLVTAADLNAHLRDNMSYLHGGKPAGAINWASGGILPGTTYADLNPSIGVTLSTTTGRVLIVFTAVGWHTATVQISLDVAMDGVRVGGAEGSYHHQIPANFRTGLSFSLFIAGLSLGTHTFRPQAKTSMSGMVILGSSDDRIHFAVAEW